MIVPLQKWSGWFLFGLVVIAQVKHPVPSRTRKLSTVAPMVLGLKPWESRAPPNLIRTNLYKRYKYQRPENNGAGWSSPVARQAHNLKVAGSNPAPATNFLKSSTEPHPNGRMLSLERKPHPKSDSCKGQLKCGSLVWAALTQVFHRTQKISAVLSCAGNDFVTVLSYANLDGPKSPCAHDGVCGSYCDRRVLWSVRAAVAVSALRLWCDRRNMTGQDCPLLRIWVVCYPNV